MCKDINYGFLLTTRKTHLRKRMWCPADRNIFKAISEVNRNLRKVAIFHRGYVFYDITIRQTEGVVNGCTYFYQVMEKPCLGNFWGTKTDDVKRRIDVMIAAPEYHNINDKHLALLKRVREYDFYTTEEFTNYIKNLTL